MRVSCESKEVHYCNETFLFIYLTLHFALFRSPAVCFTIFSASQSESPTVSRRVISLDIPPKFNVMYVRFLTKLFTRKQISHKPIYMMNQKD